MNSYYDLEISGKDVKRFIRNLYKMKINFYNIENYPNKAIIKVNKADYFKIMDIKTIYNIKIVKYYGFIKYKKFISFYKTFIIILLIGFLLFLRLINTIFTISINTSNSSLKSLIMADLKEYGISKYNRVISFNKKEEIKEKILKKHKDKIEWLEIKRIGTKYIVELEERKKNNKKINNTYQDVIAKKSGIITKINATSGEVIGKIDHYVKKGDILISGTIYKNDEIKGYVRADGSVLAETWYTVTVTLPNHYKEEIKTGKSDTFLNINYLGKNIKLFSKKFKNANTNKIIGFNNLLLPINISLLKESEISVKDNIYTIENAFFKASSIAREKLYEKLGKNIEIIFEKKLKTTEINSKIEIVIFYKVIENITDFKDINLEDKKEEIR